MGIPEYGELDGVGLAQLVREGLFTAEEGRRLAQGDPALGADRIGFSPTLGFSFMRGSLLSLVGHPREGGVELDRATERARAPQQLLPLWASHYHHTLHCEVTGDDALALAHAREVLECAERTGSQVARITAYFSLGIANVLNREWPDALEVLEQALAIGRDQHLLFAEGWVLAAMAVAHLGLGDRAKALTLAEEAMAVCRRRGARLWEVSAQLTRIRALREIHGLVAKTEIDASLAEAAAWLEMSGAKSYEPFLHVERVQLARLNGDEPSRERELREAHRLFLEIGAPIRAEQVAGELAV